MLFQPSQELLPTPPVIPLTESFSAFATPDWYLDVPNVGTAKFVPYKNDDSEGAFCLTAEGELYCFDAVNDTKPANGSSAFHPVAELKGEVISHLRDGTGKNFAISTSGKVFALGDNQQKLLGVEAFDDIFIETWQVVKILEDLSVKDLGVNARGVLVLTNDNDLYFLAAPLPSETETPPNITSFDQYKSLFLRQINTAENDFLEKVVEISAGRDHVLVRTVEGRIFSGGYIDYNSDALGHGCEYVNYRQIPLTEIRSLRLKNITELIAVNRVSYFITGNRQEVFACGMLKGNYPRLLLHAAEPILQICAEAHYFIALTDYFIYTEGVHLTGLRDRVVYRFSQPVETDKKIVAITTIDSGAAFLLHREDRRVLCINPQKIRWLERLRITLSTHTSIPPLDLPPRQPLLSACPSEIHQIISCFLDKASLRNYAATHFAVLRFLAERYSPAPLRLSLNGRLIADDNIVQVVLMQNRPEPEPRAPLTQMLVVSLNRQGVLTTQGYSEWGGHGAGHIAPAYFRKSRQVSIPNNRAIKKFVPGEGNRHLFALTDDGKLLSWGDNQYEQPAHPIEEKFSVSGVPSVIENVGTLALSVPMVDIAKDRDISGAISKKQLYLWGKLDEHFIQPQIVSFALLEEDETLCQLELAVESRRISQYEERGPVCCYAIITSKGRLISAWFNWQRIDDNMLSATAGINAVGESPIGQIAVANGCVVIVDGNGTRFLDLMPDPVVAYRFNATNLDATAPQTLVRVFDDIYWIDQQEVCRRKVRIMRYHGVAEPNFCFITNDHSFKPSYLPLRDIVRAMDDVTHMRKQRLYATMNACVVASAPMRMPLNPVISYGYLALTEGHRNNRWLRGFYLAMRTDGEYRCGAFKIDKQALQPDVISGLNQVVNSSDRFFYRHSQRRFTLLMFSSGRSNRLLADVTGRASEEIAPVTHSVAQGKTR